MSYWDNRSREPSSSDIEKIEGMRRDGAPVSDIIEAARHTAVPINGDELRSAGSLEGLRLKDIEMFGYDIRGKNLLCENVSMSSYHKYGDFGYFSGSYFKDVIWRGSVANSNFSNATFVNNSFCNSFYDVDFSKAKILGGALSKLNLFDCNIGGLKTSEDAISKIGSLDFVIGKFSPERQKSGIGHYRCHQATSNFREEDNRFLKKFKLRLSDKISPAWILLSLENKASLIFSENLQFGNDKNNFVMKDCFYNVRTAYRGDFKGAAWDGGVWDVRSKGVELRFVRPILEVWHP